MVALLENQGKKRQMSPSLERTSTVTSPIPTEENVSWQQTHHSHFFFNRNITGAKSQTGIHCDHCEGPEKWLPLFFAWRSCRRTRRHMLRACFCGSRLWILETVAGPKKRWLNRESMAMQKTTPRNQASFS